LSQAVDFENFRAARSSTNEEEKPRVRIDGYLASRHQRGCER
jgi:hypothetical protein